MLKGPVELAERTVVAAEEMADMPELGSFSEPVCEIVLLPPVAAVEERRVRAFQRTTTCSEHPSTAGSQMLLTG